MPIPFLTLQQILICVVGSNREMKCGVAIVAATLRVNLCLTISPSEYRGVCMAGHGFSCPLQTMNQCVWLAGMKSNTHDEVHISIQAEITYAIAEVCFP